MNSPDNLQERNINPLKLKSISQNFDKISISDPDLIQQKPQIDD